MVVVAEVVVLVAVVAKHRLELPPQTSTVWQNLDPQKPSQLLAWLGKEGGRAENTGREPHHEMQIALSKKLRILHKSEIKWWVVKAGMTPQK